MVFQFLNSLFMKLINTYLKFRKAFFYSPHNLEFYINDISFKDSAKYIYDNFYNVKYYYNSRDLINFALSFQANKDDLIAEFGVFKGKSINYISSKTKNTVYGFDTFEGTNEKFSIYMDMKDFHLGQLPKVNENVKLIKGLFQNSLPSFLSENSGKKFQFLHIDSDTYESTYFVLKSCKNMLHKDTFILFDDFLTIPGWRYNQFKAFNDFIKENPDIKYEYSGMSLYQMLIKIN